MERFKITYHAILFPAMGTNPIGLSLCEKASSSYIKVSRLKYIILNCPKEMWTSSLLISASYLEGLRHG